MRVDFGLSLRVADAAVYSSIFAHEYGDGRAVKFPAFADFVLQVSAVWFFNPLWQVAEEYECRDDGFAQLGDVFDFNKFALVGGWWICGDGFEHVGVELRGGHGAFAVL